MSKAQLVISAVVLEGRSKSEVARDYEVSRQWVHQLVTRYETEGAAAFQPRSRRPHTNPWAINAELEERIVRLRKTLDKAGYDAGATTIAEHLTRDPGTTKTPALSTIWRILRRRGFVVPQPHKRPRSAWKRFTAAQPNELWQADVTHWQLADHTEVEILNLLDDHSRVGLASLARTTIGGNDVVDTFTTAFTRWGTPASSSPPPPAAADAPPCRSSSANSASSTSPPGPTTRRPAARSSDSTKHSRNGYGPCPAHTPSPNFNTSSMTSWPTTTGSDPTGPSAVTLPCKRLTPAPKPFPPATASPRTTGSATTASTPPASSPSATTATYTTSGCPNTCAAPRSSCSSTTSTSACSTTTPEH